MTIGPSRRSSSSGAYGVSEFKVSPTCLGSVTSVPNTEFARTPRTSLPLKMARPDTDAKKNR